MFNNELREPNFQTALNYEIPVDHIKTLRDEYEERYIARDIMLECEDLIKEIIRVYSLKKNNANLGYIKDKILNLIFEYFQHENKQVYGNTISVIYNFSRLRKGVHIIKPYWNKRTLYFDHGHTTEDNQITEYTTVFIPFYKTHSFRRFFNLKANMWSTSKNFLFNKSESQKLKIKLESIYRGSK